MSLASAGNGTLDRFAHHAVRLCRSAIAGRYASSPFLTIMIANGASAGSLSPIVC